jgi:anthranilate phosphoribosyltransferase
VHRLDGGEVSTFTIDARDFDMPHVTIDALAGGDAATNADHVRAVLEGHHGPKRDIAVLNAGAALLVARIAADLADGVRLASDAVDGGYAAEALESMVRVSTACAQEEARAQENAR